MPSPCPGRSRAVPSPGDVAAVAIAVTTLLSAAAYGESEPIGVAEAEAIALETVEGIVTEITIERKVGAERYVVEVLTPNGETETDVVIDMATGEVLAVED